MKFAIITHVVHKKKENRYFGYSPYVKEMNIWLKYVDQLIIVAPTSNITISEIDDFYDFDSIDYKEIPNFNITSLLNIIKTFFLVPIIFWRIFLVMREADHIHLRCPGNIGLIGCFVQIAFPKKRKTAKYAGNWDSRSIQPFTYHLQKWILNNRFLTRNIQVLVYGDWKKQSENIKPFFTATYCESEKEVIEKMELKNGIKFIFVGSLISGKNPLYGIKLVEKLIRKGHVATLDLYGDGVERKALENYIQMNKLEKYIFLRGNNNKETLKSAYKKSHFVILPSKSEGWPKAIAEGMFWGCIPIATKVSCVPYMLDFGNGGILLEMELNKDAEQIENLIVNQNTFLKKSQIAMEWSRNFTTDVFEKEIAKLLMK